MGPWVYATRIVSHTQYTFYNPHYMPYLSEEDGRILYFQATYTKTFSGNTSPTPRYNYNQIQYRLDLDDDRLVMPTPVYVVPSGVTPSAFATKGTLPQGLLAPAVAFFAPDRSFPDSVEVFSGSAGLVTGTGAGEPLFFCRAEAGEVTVPLWRFESADGPAVHAVDASWTGPGYTLVDEPLCHVWPDPIGHDLPVGDYRAEVVGNDLCTSLECPGGSGTCAWEPIPACCITDDDCLADYCPAPGATCQ